MIPSPNATSKKTTKNHEEKDGTSNQSSLSIKWNLQPRIVSISWTTLSRVATSRLHIHFFAGPCIFEVLMLVQATNFSTLKINHIAENCTQKEEVTMSHLAHKIQKSWLILKLKIFWLIFLVKGLAFDIHVPQTVNEIELDTSTNIYII